MSYPRYAEYKDSGVEWLGEIPAHWEIWKLGHAFSYISSGTTPPSDSLKYYGGNIPWVTTSELRENVIFETTKNITEQAIKENPSLKIHPIGSVVIAMYGAT